MECIVSAVMLFVIGVDMTDVSSSKKLEGMVNRG